MRHSADREQLTDQGVLAWLDMLPQRLTRLQFDLARALLREEQPVTAQLLYQRLQAAGVTTSLGAIYRILKQWEESGMVRRDWERSVLRQKAVYSFRREPVHQRSYTFECSACGRKKRMTEPAFEGPLTLLCQQEAFELPDDIVIPVHCAECGGKSSI